jgi:hypothetical protein
MKIKLFLITVFLILVKLSCFAQLENPCGGTGDPDAPSTCPLDTWVFVLVAAFFIYATVKLYRRQKIETAV